MRDPLIILLYITSTYVSRSERDCSCHRPMVWPISCKMVPVEQAEDPAIACSPPAIPTTASHWPLGFAVKLKLTKLTSVPLGTNWISPVNVLLNSVIAELRLLAPFVMI